MDEGDGGGVAEILVPDLGERAEHALQHRIVCDGEATKDALLVAGP